MRDFYIRVYEIVDQIPYGRVTSYGAIANALGAGKSSRLVGIAMNYSHQIAPNIPAHRVVNRNGLLTGRHHFIYDHTMEELLSFEGIRVLDNQIVDFKRLFWDPLVDG
ncbi:MGMT family protein [Sphingobacterium corticibacter]|uniref:Cysteine methyltransferase n=1 Tax=Sphingobacterium corticibacter TaxID=2171749 RepID=A0A2T8HH13_9SPHI|nr:MGMT family protein [Sphingobacterium corticibacter]PVH24721.1 cysteine methyltransferase [Sphingobacterium corticibacter]